MDSAEFCRPYRVNSDLAVPRVTSADIAAVPEGEFRQLFASSQSWSNIFGTLLHLKLSGEDTEQIDVSGILTAYHSWTTREMGVIHDISRQWHQSLINSGADRTLLKRSATYRQHSGFHDINRHHLDQWFIHMSSASPEAIRLAALDSKFALGCLGSHYAKFRDAEIKKNGEPAWFDEDKRIDRQSLEGFLHEVDAGIVLQDLAARPDHGWMCVPAPMQFESHACGDSNTRSANVDYIIFDPVTKGVIGTQVKSLVSEHEVDAYDDSRVVLIDSRVDLGNEAGKRTNRRSSSVQVVSWGGQIAIEHLAHTSVKHPRYGRLIRSGNTMALKQFATRAAKDQHPQMRSAAKRIAPRVEAKL